MLVLERKVQQGFWLDDRIFVKVIGIGKRRVKLGIDAPTSVIVTRDDIRVMQDGNQDAHLQQVLPERRQQQ